MTTDPLTQCDIGQGFAKNYNPSYKGWNLLGHTGQDETCGYGSDIRALANGIVYSAYTPAKPASDGYTAVFTLCRTPLETFEFSYGHVSEITTHIGDTVLVGDVIAKEGNRGVVYSGNTLITLAMQAAGNKHGSHRHYQKRRVLERMRTTGGRMLQTATGTYRDYMGSYYEIADPNNGFNGCVDWTAPLFDYDLGVSEASYEVLMLQRAMVIEGF